MHLLVVIAAAAVVALIAYNVIEYMKATGSVADRLAAAWQGSMTIFVVVWGSILSFGVSGLDILSEVTGDPQFSAIADGIKNYIPAQYHPLIPVGVGLVAILARLRTLPKAS
jgi:hypothetical protein